jgi:hypothetical protein
MTNGTTAGTLSAGRGIVPFVTGRTRFPVKFFYQRVCFRGKIGEPLRENLTYRAYRAFRAIFPRVGNRSAAGQVLKALRAHKAHTSPQAR